MNLIDGGSEKVRSQLKELIFITDQMNRLFRKTLNEYEKKENEMVSLTDVTDLEAFKYILKGVKTKSMQISEFINEGLRGSKVINIKQVDKNIITANEEINGEDICLIYFMEESAEVIKELSKMIRHKGNKKHLTSEIADLYYTLSMLIQKYEISEDEINEYIVEKEIYARQELEKEAKRSGMSGV